MPKILITGGLGFLGSYAIDRYADEGWEITVIDNLSSNAIEPDHPICQRANVIIGDVLDWSWAESPSFDLILHLASPVGPVGILVHSGKMARYMLDDIYWAVEGAQRHACPLIYVSTSEIYGYRPEATLLKESDDKLLVGEFSVRNEYSIAKLLGEIVLSNTAKVTDIKYQIVRPFNISGARQLRNGGFVLPTFVQQALDGRPLTVFGDGEQVRAFTHVSDIIDGIYRISQSKEYNEAWNIGHSNNVTTINQLAEYVRTQVGGSSDIIHVDPKTIHGPLYEEAWDKIPDASKAKSRLGWQPKWTAQAIVRDVVSFYARSRERLDLVDDRGPDEVQDPVQDRVQDPLRSQDVAR